MEPRRFDSLTRSLSSRLSRRTALQATGLAGAASLVSAASLKANGLGAAATPDPLGDETSFLFVQSATGGTFAANPGAGTASTDGTPTPGGGADYLLTMEGHTGNTVYFSDRPERIFGTAPTPQFLDGLGFSPDNPPNAALVTNDADGNEDILVVELVEPSYDAAADTVTYGVNILSDYEGGLGFAAGRAQDEDLAPTFGAASLFIDDCSDEVILCDDSSGQVGSLGSYNFCWSFGDLCCQPCQGHDWPKLCNETFPACGGDCSVSREGCW